jgi:hypothetical protein
MKNLILFAMLTLLAVGCVKQEPIPQTELTGIWKLNGYSSSNYKVEITQDGYLYWWNYNDIFNNIEEFEVDYNINRNEMKLYFSGENRMIHQIRIYRERNGRLYFSVPITGLDADGNTITNTDTYYKMN